MKTTTYTDKSIAVNKEYNYVVRPYNSNATGKDSSYVYVSTKVGIPGLSAYSDSSGSIRTYISIPSRSQGYQLYRSTSENGIYKEIKTSTYQYYYDESVTPGKTYYYKARAISVVNGKKYYGEFTTPRSAVAIVPVPRYPTVSVAGENSIYLKWNAVQGVTGYDIYRSEGTSSSSSFVKIASTKNTYYTDKKLNKDTYYYYKIVAYKTVSGENYYSSMSSYSSARTAFTVPYNFSITSSGMNTHILTYKKPAGAGGVEIYCDSGSGYELIKTTTAESYTFKNREANRTYYYKIRAFRTVNGTKEFTSYVSQSYKTVLPAATGLKATNVSTASIKLSWSAVKNATIYYVYRATSPTGSYYSIGSTETTSYVDATAKVDVIYYYKIEARRNINGYYNYGTYTDPVKIIARCAATKITSITPESTTSVKVKWNKTDEAVSYNLYRSTSKSGSYSLVKSGITSTSYIDKSLKYGKTYYYKVVVVGAPSGIPNSSAASSAVSGKTGLKKPSLTATSTSVSSITLTWSKNSEAAGYLIYRATSKNGKYSQVAKISKNSTVTYVDKNLKAGTTYYYKMIVYKKQSGETIKSEYSSIVSAKAVPSKVTGLKVSATAVNGIRIIWTKNSYAGSYYVYRATSKSGTYKKIATISKNSTVTYTDKSVNAGSTYYYKIVAFKKSGSKTYNASASDLVSAKAVPSAVNSFKVSSVTSKTVKLTWKENSGATGYYIYRATSKSGTYSKVASISKKATVSYTDSGLKSKTTYYYKIVSYKTVSSKTYTSAASSVISAKTK